MPISSLRNPGADRTPRASWPWIAPAAIAAGGLTAPLITYGRVAIFDPSLAWAGLAAAVAGSLILLFGLQALLLSRLAGLDRPAALRAASRSFAPLLILWPLLLLVEFWDVANHVFVFYPAVDLYWGSVAFAFAVTQLALVPVAADGGFDWLTRGVRRDWRALRAKIPPVEPRLWPVVFAYASMRLTILFAFDTSTRIDPQPAFSGFYKLATLSDQGVWPFLQRWSEYPPVFPWLSSGIYQAVSFFGVTYERYYFAMTLALLLFSLGSLVLVYALTRLAWGRRTAVTVAWSYTVLAVPIHEWMRSFDSIAIFFMLLATYLAITRRPHSGMLAMVLGTLTKVMPLPVGVLEYIADSQGEPFAVVVTKSARFVKCLPHPFDVAPGYDSACAKGMGQHPALRSVGRPAVIDVKCPVRYRQQMPGQEYL